jgi:hypothetical protein
VLTIEFLEVGKGFNFYQNGHTHIMLTERPANQILEKITDAIT